ncbi:methyl-accepting chemotaxis protein [Alkalihalobacillus sp. BA299]|uniref:methyl-accepting chemotaxis protein n=1 Tax=Alkalihalobacillus sp. BA299 TaxID=2815938 RepID=UPI001AD9560B|nr:methyl-accepting chemotaxis protein [Alkalihalobacillus sp. BA299]
MFRLKRLHHKMLLIFALLFVVIIGSTVFINYQQTSSLMEKDVRNQASIIVHELKDNVELYLSNYSSNLTYFSHDGTIQEYVKSDEENKGEAWANVSTNFSHFLDINPNINIIYIAEASKEIRIEPHVDLPSDFDPTSRPWYVNALETPEQVVWSEPYIDTATDDYVITASKAILDPIRNSIDGVVALDLTLDKVAESVNAVDVGYEGYTFLLDDQGVAIVHPEERGNNLAEQDYISELYNQPDHNGILDYYYKSTNQVLIYDTIQETNWKVGAVYLQNNLLEGANTVRNNSFIVAGVALLLALIIIYFVSIGITRSIGRLNQVVEEVANGDLTVNIETNSKDEIGQLTTNFNQMIINMRSLISEVNKSVKQVASSADNLSAVSEETKASSEEVAKAISGIATNTSESASSADSTSQQTLGLSSEISNVASQTEKISDQFEQVEQVNEHGLVQVKTLRESANESTVVIENVERVILGLSKKVTEIENIIATINGISEQTNLLALNASIEAARAGEHGKGFSVVAVEVRKLAEQSSKATEMVRQTIRGIQEESNLAVNEMSITKEIAFKQQQVVEDTEDAFHSISEAVQSMSHSINQITKDLNGINEFKDDVVSSIQIISSMSQETAAACEEVSASTDEQLTVLESIADSAEELQASSEQLYAMIRKFKISKDDSTENKN